MKTKQKIMLFAIFLGIATSLFVKYPDPMIKNEKNNNVLLYIEYINGDSVFYIRPKQNIRLVYTMRIIEVYTIDINGTESIIRIPFYNIKNFNLIKNYTSPEQLRQ